MKWFLFAVAMLVSQAAAVAQQPTVSVLIVTAQDEAEEMARTGVLRHCGRAGGRYEGIGFGRSRDAAIKNSCFWGSRRPVEIGAAYSRVRRGWFACVRYE